MSAAPRTPPAKTDAAGLAAAVLCFSIWGLYPILFQLAARAGASSMELVAWRALLSVPVGAAIVALTGQWPALVAMAGQPRTLLTLAGSAALIGVNWVIYVWAVQHAQNLATSLGYYINPLLNVAVGAWLFRERPSRSAYVAIALAVVGVGVQALAIGGVPWISLVLALTFCAYGVVRKRLEVGAQAGFLVETLVLSVPASVFVTLAALHGTGVFGRSLPATAILLVCGPATAIPFAAFGFATRRLPLGLIGFLQFIQPTMIFACGVAGGEPVTPLRLVSFALIWAGVAVFVAGAWRRMRRVNAPSASP